MSNHYRPEMLTVRAPVQPVYFRKLATNMARVVLSLPTQGD